MNCKCQLVITVVSEINIGNRKHLQMTQQRAPSNDIKKTSKYHLSKN